MLHPSVKTVRNDLRTLLRDAQELFQEAAEATGERADGLRARGLDLLDTAAYRTRELNAAAIATGRELAASTDEYVHRNPWRATALAAGIGFLAGVAIGRK